MCIRDSGGIKGTGVCHFLTKMWQEILSGLEEDKAAVSIMSVDFSKAFNCLQHQACLNALARRGASNQTIKMIYNFLSNRTMVVRNGLKESMERAVTGGSPQGTKLGNVLFCLTVEGVHETWENNRTVPHPLSPVMHTEQTYLSLIHI